MSTRFLGVGPGVIIVATIWILAFITVLVFSKIKKPTSFVGAFGLILAFIVTTILLCIPREKEADVSQTITADQDTLFVWRTVLLVFELCSLLVAVTCMVTQHWAVPVKAKTLSFPSRGTISLKAR